MSSMLLEMEGCILDADENSAALGRLFHYVDGLPDRDSLESLKEIMGYLHDDLTTAICKVSLQWKAITEMEICAR